MAILTKAQKSSYAELLSYSHYSFLRGGSSPAEMVKRASELGLSALAITDRDGVYGIPKAYVAWKCLPEEKRGQLKLITGAELTLHLHSEKVRIALLAKSRKGYALLCRLITASHQNQPKGEASLDAALFLGWMKRLFTEEAEIGLFFIPEETLILRYPDFLTQLSQFVPGHLFLPISRSFEGADEKRINSIVSLSKELALPLVATVQAHLHHPDRRYLQDTLTAIRENKSLDELGRLLFSNSERHLKSPEEVGALFSDLPQAVKNTVLIASACHFCPSELRYRYPSEWIPEGETAHDYLKRLTYEGAGNRYGNFIPEDVDRQLQHELQLVNELGFSDYFLTIYEIVDFARERNILCQGRGSAANSAICYCLGITAIDPVRMNLLFERFISAERGEPPDIDVDFEHERREEVIQHIYEKYGRDRAGMVAAVITYRSKSALRDVAKALGLLPEKAEQSAGALRLIDQMKGVPRHLSIHSGGFTLSADPMIETVPIEPARMEGRTIIQWDKEDLSAMGLLKVDILALGMLSALRKCLNEVGLELYCVPADDAKTYKMIQAGDTVGVFQIESRAQISMLKRLLPKTFYDLVIEVAIVRPGPIVGEMVHPYLRRRRGLESSASPHPKLEKILGRTLGVPLFQEQVMKMAIELAGFTAGEADELRRAIGAWRSTGSIEKMGRKLQDGLLKSGLPAEFVERVFAQIHGFAEYGFPESHAASFALLAYASSYLKCHYPAQFVWALINSQPMGFYSAHTLIDEAKRNGVQFLPVDVQKSEWDCTLERQTDGSPPQVRLGLRLVRGMSKNEAEALLEGRKRGGVFQSLAQLIYRVKLDPRILERLALGGAFRCFGLNQRQTFWEILSYQSGRVEEVQLSFFQSALFTAAESSTQFRALTTAQEIEADYQSYGVSTRGHPMEIFRRSLSQSWSSQTSQGVKKFRNGSHVKVAGLVISRQRPPTAKGTAFATLEDEEGFLDLIFHKTVIDRYEDVFFDHAFLGVTGSIQIDGIAISLIVSKIEALSV